MFVSKSINNDIDVSKYIEEMLNDPDFAIKTVLVGSSKTGKTSLINVFCFSHFEDANTDDVATSKETIINSTTVEVDRKNIKMELWDCFSDMQKSSQEKRKLQYVGAMIFLVCVDVTNETSFEDALQYWIPEIRSVTTDTPIILCGTKKDLLAEFNENGFGRARFISHEKMVNLAKKNSCLTYFEVSAKENESSVLELFINALKGSLGIWKEETGSKKCLIQ
ncbi:hypothetical protein ABK040_013530 [Willaertia magna]